MTTDRQRKANSQNAKKSTGPKSGSGKNTASSNARRHGLTGTLDDDSTLAWYRVILDDPLVTPYAFERDPYLRAAADLARAEAHLQRVRLAEERWLTGPEQPPKAELTSEKQRSIISGILIELALDAEFLQIPLEERLFLPKGMPSHPEWEHKDLLEQFIANPFVKKGWNSKGFRIMRSLDKAVRREHKRTETRHQRMGRTLARYRASAEARRRIALSRLVDQVVVQSA